MYAHIHTSESYLGYQRLRYILCRVVFLLFFVNTVCCKSNTCCSKVLTFSIMNNEQRCKILIIFIAIRRIIFLFQATFPTETDMLADDLNSIFSTPRELRCGEYSFKLKMNPWQHPIFDENIYHLLALLTSLRRGCGGVVYLMADDTENITQEIVQVYKERLHELLNRGIRLSLLLTNMVPVTLQLGTDRSLAALLMKKSYDTLQNLTLETKGTWKPIIFEMDMFGQMHTRSVLDTQCHGHRQNERPAISYGPETDSTALVSSPRQKSMFSQTEPGASCAIRPSLSTGQVTDNPALVSTRRQENTSRQIDPETIHIIKTRPISVRVFSCAAPQVDYSFCQTLNWTENTKDWQKYVHIKEVQTDDIVRECPIWTPTSPMKTTPDEDSIRYLFKSQKNMKETMSTVATKEPGCAVVCRTWRFHIPYDNVNEDLPPGHICDILTVTDTGKMSFWVIVDGFEEAKFHDQIDYLMTTGCMLKYQLVQKGEGDDLSNLWINCRLLPLHTSHSMKKSVGLRLVESQEIQAHLCHINQDTADFASLQRALTKLILSKESPLKRCIGDHTSITLSIQQLEVLMHKAKVNYITGPAGSGKSYTGASLCKMYGKQNSVYICTTKEFLEYLKFNGYTGTLILSDQDLLREIKSRSFENKKCVVIDDCHKFTCTRKSLKKLFKVLKKAKDMSLVVFADHDYQSFDRRQQKAVHDCILDLTYMAFKHFPLNFPLTDIYRNTRKVVSFVQAAVQEVHEDYETIKSANAENGEGVEFISMSSVWENKQDNDLVVYLRSLLLSGNYSQSEIAILLESSYTQNEIQQCREILEEHATYIAVQSADAFPRKGVIVDTVDSFIGLDSCVCVFILSNIGRKSAQTPRRIFQRRTIQYEPSMYNPRYQVFLASRATHKAVFVVPKFHEDLLQEMKFDHFQVGMWN